MASALFEFLCLVPTLRVGMQSGALRPLGAERRKTAPTLRVGVRPNQRGRVDSLRFRYAAESVNG